MTDRPRTYQDPEQAPDDRSNEDPGNFKRTPPAVETEQDPLDSGRRFNSNQILLISMVVGVILAALLAVWYLAA